MSKQGKIVTITAAIVLGAWLTLVFSSKGLLVYGKAPDADRKVGMLKCKYFTGTGIIEKQFLYSDEGFLGRQVCPRTVDLK
jgi:hypothetical protein